MGRSSADDCGEVVCIRSEGILDILVESSISRERSCGMIDRQVEEKDTDDLRNEFCWEV